MSEDKAREFAEMTQLLCREAPEDSRDMICRDCAVRALMAARTFRLEKAVAEHFKPMIAKYEGWNPQAAEEWKRMRAEAHAELATARSRAPEEG